MLKTCIQSTLAVVFALLSCAAFGQQNLQTMPFGTPIGNEAAKKMAAAAVSEAKKNGWPVCVAIVDYHGDLVYFERLDNTQLGSVTVAVDKARTPAKFKRSTKLLEDAVSGGRNAICDWATPPRSRAGCRLWWTENLSAQSASPGSRRSRTSRLPLPG